MLPSRVKYIIEKIAIKLELIDILRLRRERGETACVCYYFLLTISLLIFSISLLLTHIPESAEVLQKNKRLVDAIEAFQLKAPVFNLDIRGKLAPEASEDQSVIMSFGLVSVVADDKPGDGKWDATTKSHSFPTKFYLNKDRDSLPKELFGDFKANPSESFGQGDRSENKKLVITKHKCINLQYKGKESSAHQSWKSFSLEPCEKGDLQSKSKQPKGIKFNLIKLEPEIFKQTHCATSQACRHFCQEKDMLYFDGNFINDKLKNNITTCYKPLVAKEICAVVEKNKEDYAFVAGCFGGELELYERLKVLIILMKFYFFTRIKLISPLS
jgi:hypothetical protein